MSVVGVDIGGTTTRFAIASLDEHEGAIEREGVVSSSSWRGPLGDPKADAAGLRTLLIEQFGTGVLQLPLAVGAHGCDNTEQCNSLERELRAHFSGPVLAVNDSELMVPAMGIEEGIGVVVGTGSIATARNDDGMLLTAGGWGWLLGDEGSAPGLVRESMRVVLTELDRGHTTDPLVARLLGAFDALAATLSASAESWGTHAPVVFAAADEGSPLAETVIREAGEVLASLIGALRSRGVRSNTAVAGGSVIEQQPRLQHAVTEALARDLPGMTLQILDRPPLVGALALARRIAIDATTPIRSEN
jgi:glucosamine kinase